MPAAQAVGLEPFDEFGAGKIAEARTAQIRPLVTVLDRSAQHDVSGIGTRWTRALLDAGTVQDLYLTTTARSGGEPDTPLYIGGRPPALDAIVTKRSTDPEAPFTFQHLAVTSSRSAATPRR